MIDKKHFALWLPEGSVRAILALGGLAIVGYLAIANQNEIALGAVAAVIGGAVNKYFESRKDGATL